MTRFRFAIALLAAIGLVASACGQPQGEAQTATDITDAGQTASPEDRGQLVLASIAADTEAATTGRFEGRVTMVVEPGAGVDSVAIKLDGGFNLAENTNEMTVDLSEFAKLMQTAPGAGEQDPVDTLGMFTGMFDQPIRFVGINDRGFVNWPFLSVLVTSFGPSADSTPTGPSAEELWIEGTAENLGPAELGLGAGGLTDDMLPTELLDRLLDVDAEVEEVGPETIRGVKTTRYRATLDAEALTNAAADKLPDESLEGTERLDRLGDLSDVPVELWVDGEGVARKLSMEIDETHLRAGVAGQNGISPTDRQLPIQSMTVEFELFDLGEPVIITAPPEENVIDGDALGFGGELFGQSLDDPFES